MPRVELKGYIKDVKLKPDQIAGEPELEMKLDLGTVNPDSMHTLMRAWSDGKSKVIVTIEPAIEQKSLGFDGVTVTAHPVEQSA